MPIRGGQTGESVRLRRRKSQSQPNKLVGLFGSEGRNANPGRTNRWGCSAQKAETPIQAEQTGESVRLRRRKSQSQPNKLVKVFGSEGGKANPSRTNRYERSAQKAEKPIPAEQTGMSVRLKIQNIRLGNQKYGSLAFFEKISV